MPSIRTERDIQILLLIDSFRFVMGRHVCDLFFFGSRTYEKRLKRLLDEGFIKKERPVFGLPYLYTLTHKGRMLIGVNKAALSIRLDHIRHDMIVLDMLVVLVRERKLALSSIVSERNLHQEAGFGNRKHMPDFIFQDGDGWSCVEVELNKKSNHRLEENVRKNFQNYRFQYWVIPKNKRGIEQQLRTAAHVYPHLHILYIEDVVKHD